MKTFQVIDLFCTATDNLNNVFKMIGYLDSNDLDDLAPQLVISPAASIVRELMDRISSELFTDDELEARNNLYLHCHRTAAEKRISEDGTAEVSDEAVLYEAIASFETDASLLFFAAHRIYKEMQDAQNRFGLMAYEP